MEEDESSFEEKFPKSKTGSTNRQMAEGKATKILQNSKLFGTPERQKKYLAAPILKDFETFNDSSIQYSIPCQMEPHIQHEKSLDGNMISITTSHNVYLVSKKLSLIGQLRPRWEQSVPFWSAKRKYLSVKVV